MRDKELIKNKCVITMINAAKERYPVLSGKVGFN